MAVPQLAELVLPMLMLTSMWPQCQSTHVRLGFLFYDSTTTTRGGTELADRFGYHTSAAAATIAISRAQMEDLTSNVTFSLHWRMTNCDASLAAESAYELINGLGVRVVFGPPCDNEAVLVPVPDPVKYLVKCQMSRKVSKVMVWDCPLAATVASYYDVPVVSWAAAAAALEDRTRFPAVALSIATTERLAHAVQQLLAFYKWDRVGLLYTDDPTGECRSLASSLVKVLAKADVLVANTVIMPATGPVNEQDAAGFFNRITALIRVIIVCADRGLDTIMLGGREAGISTNEEFVVIVTKTVMSEVDYPWHSVADTEKEQTLRQACNNTLFVTTRLASSESLRQFERTVPIKMQEAPFFSTGGSGFAQRGVSASRLAPMLHDAVYLYIVAAARALANGVDLASGTETIRYANGLRFGGISGSVVLSETRSRMPEFVVRSLRPPTADGRLVDLTIVRTDQPNGEQVQEIVSSEEMWAGRNGFIPTGYPQCGWDGQRCRNEPVLVVVLFVCGVTMAILTIMLIVAGFVYYIKRRVLVNKMAEALWKVSIKQVVPLRKLHSRESASFQQVATVMSEEMQEAMIRGYEDTALYNGIIVWMNKHMHVDSHGVTDAGGAISRQQAFAHLKEMRELSDENLNNFYGLVLDVRIPISLWAYLSKGSLADVLINSSVKLDAFFKFSFIRDISNVKTVTQGLDALHRSGINSHGHLTSTNCLVDGRWVIKLTDFGLHMLRENVHYEAVVCAGQKTQNCAARLWMAPELLRSSTLVAGGSQKADIFAYAIVQSEIWTRKLPYTMYEDTAPDMVVSNVRRGESPPFRPKVSVGEGDWNKAMQKLMEDCWAENAADRPTIKEIKATVKTLGQGQSMNLMDHALNMMEQYAKKLESQVNSRTRDLEEEFEKSDRLLYRMLPESVASKLKTGEKVLPENYDAVTVFFSDVHQFANLTARSEPLQIVTLLNQLYTLLDSIIEEYDVYKVETINDSYLCVSGLPKRNGNEHAAQIADMALHFQISIAGFFVPHLPQERLQLRIGMNSGPVTAGVVGLTMPRYCLFGDTVNVASRIETNGKPSCIHISDTTNKYLTEVLGGYLTKPRGEIIVKGKGVMTTHWLLGKTSQDLHDHSDLQETGPGMNHQNTEETTA